MWQTIEAGVDQQVLTHRQAMRQIDEWRGEIEPRQHSIAVPQHVFAEDLYFAGSLQQKPEHDREGGRLPRAVAPQQRRCYPTLHREADPVYRDGPRITFHQAVDFDGGRGHRPYMTRSRAFGQRATSNCYRE